MSTGLRVSADLPASFLEAVAERAAELVLECIGEHPQASPYLSVDEAAEYLRCSKQRVYELLSARRLSKLKDGSRVLLLRSELDEYVSQGVARALPPSSPRRIRKEVAA
jgi:excisionase family DNA binding protein